MAMPSGPPICAAAGVGAPHNRAGYISWPTPTLSMSQPGPKSASPAGAQRDTRDHPTQFVARRISGLSSRPSKGGDLNPDAQLLVDGFPDPLGSTVRLRQRHRPSSRGQSIVAAAKPSGPCPARGPRAYDALDQGKPEPAHRPAKSENVPRFGHPRRQFGRQRLLRRLRTAQPDLHDAQCAWLRDKRLRWCLIEASSCAPDPARLAEKNSRLARR